MVTRSAAIRDSCNRKAIELLIVENADHDSVGKIEEHGGRLVNFLAGAGVS